VAAIFDEFRGLLRDFVKMYPNFIFWILLMAFLCVILILGVIIFLCLAVILVIVFKLYQYLFPPDPNAPRRNADGRWYNPRTGRFI
jgi:hypothetical protein